VVHIRKARPMDIAFADSLENTLTEWTSGADVDAYRDF
jgi:hypothetical protein